MQTKLSSKGQIILPKSIRDKHGWCVGINFIIKDTKKGILLIPIANEKNHSINSLAGCLAYEGKAKSLADMDTAIKQGIKKRDRD